MESYRNDNDLANHVNEPSPDYEKAELDLLKTALNRSYTERFHVMMQLIKRGIMFRNAKITPPDEFPLKAE